jgi:hypothetical protein
MENDVGRLELARAQKKEGAGRASSKTSGLRRASFLSVSEQYHFTATSVRVRAFVYGVQNFENFDEPRGERSPRARILASSITSKMIKAASAAAVK